MRKLLMLAVVAVLVPTASHAQFTLGARVAYAPAMGDAAKDQKMSDGVKSQVPIQIDALYKVTPDVAVGAYFSYGFGQLASDFCDAGASCSASDLRFGVQALYSFNKVHPQLVPWAGVGIGYEIANATEEAGGAKAEFGYKGVEFLNLQVGANYKVNEKFSVGPYAQLSIGQYSTADVTIPGFLDASGDITDKGIHEWLGFGLRGSFDL